MAEVLFVSKPIGPPWHDSSKNLVRDLAGHLRGHRAHVMVRRGENVPLSGAVPEPIYGAQGGGFALGRLDQVRALRRLLLGPRLDLVHFFFAPNPKSSTAAAAALRMRPIPSVQTVCSAPRADLAIQPLLFADRVVVLSEHTRRRFLDAGVAAERLALVAPSVPDLALPSGASVAAAYARAGIPRDLGPVLLYPGDLEFGAGADRCLDLLEDLAAHTAVLVIAARDKTPHARERRRALAERAAAMGLRERVLFVGETPDLYAVMAGAQLVLLPSETLYAKMDVPLVLLEAMQLRRPVLVLEGTPAAELADAGVALAVPDRREDLAASATRLLDDDDFRQRQVSRAESHVATHHSPTAMAAQYALLYDDLLADRA